MASHLSDSFISLACIIRIIGDVKCTIFHLTFDERPGDWAPRIHADIYVVAAIKNVRFIAFFRLLRLPIMFENYLTVRRI